jgi:GTP-binding protein
MAAPGERRAGALIDTAGMRKKAKVDDKLEKLSVADARARGRLRRSGRAAARRHARLESQDLRIADNVLQEGRALIVAINKWDVAEGQARCSTASRRRWTRG